MDEKDKAIQDLRRENERLREELDFQRDEFNRFLTGLHLEELTAKEERIFERRFGEHDTD